MNKRLGFFGGCFNPPTIAHIELIEVAIKKVNLDKVYFVPMGNLYSKEGLIDIKHRVNMLNLAIKHNSKLEILDILPTDKKMHAIDSFKIINEKFKTSNNFFIMGSDNFEKIKTWKNAEELLSNYQYIILDRGKIKIKNLVIIKTLSKYKEISSSMIREKIKRQEKTEKLIIKEIQKYILENKLYQ